MRDAIDQARQSGWQLRKTVGHGYGRIFCRRVEPGGAVCKVPIFTTPQRPEDRAKDIVRAIRDCPHHYADQTANLSYADDLITGAEKLLDAAENFLKAELALAGASDAWQRAQDLLDLAMADAEEVQRIMVVAQEFDEEARTFTQRGWIRGSEAGGTDGSPSTYVAIAQERAEEASGVVAQVPDRDDPVLIALQGRLTFTNGRIADIRLRLSPSKP